MKFMRAKKLINKIRSPGELRTYVSSARFFILAKTAEASKLK